jgi:hypothetical protein
LEFKFNQSKKEMGLAILFYEARNKYHEAHKAHNEYHEAHSSRAEVKRSIPF